MLNEERIGSSSQPGWRPATLAFVLSFITGCASLNHTSPRAEPAVQISRSERIFLYQSQVADALLDRYPLPEAFTQQADPALLAAESRLNEACSPLTRVVLAELQGETPSLRLRFKVLTSLDDCERAAERLDYLLNRPAVSLPRTDSI